MTIRWLALLVAVMGLALLALLVASKGGQREMPGSAGERQAVRRFGRRKGEPRRIRRSPRRAASG